MFQASRFPAPRTIIIIALILSSTALATYGTWSLKTRLLSGRTEQLARTVRQAHAEAVNYHRLASAGDMGRAGAQQAALQTLANLRHSDNEYFWVTDYEGRLLMHPVLPELKGKLLSTRERSSGALLHDQVSKVLHQEGEGFLHYRWPKPGSSQAVEKIGYVQGFEPWGWGIGSGVYVDDINAAFWKEARTLAGIGLILLMLLLTFWYGFHTMLFPSRHRRDLR